MCEVLEPIISAKIKDEIAQTLLKILEHSGKAKEFLCDIVMAEVQQVGKGERERERKGGRGLEKRNATFILKVD